MRRYRIISEKVKQAGCWLLIIVLLPYIITVFINGPKIITASKADETMVKIEKNGKMPVEEYCIGVLARDMPADYEKEALNAQAVLIRTEVYRMIQEAGGDGTLPEEAADEFWTEKQMKSAWGMRYAVCGKLPKVKKRTGIDCGTSAVLWKRSGNDTIF